MTLAEIQNLNQTSGISKSKADKRYSVDQIDQLATSARTAKTLPYGQVVWDSTLQAFYVGDGRTAGGNASATGLTDQEAVSSGWIIPRHKRIGLKLQAALNEGTSTFAFSGHFFGNSIAEGDGSSDPTKRPPAVLKNLLAAYTGIASSNWTVSSYGVGGSTTATVMMFLADNADAGPGFPRRPTSFQTINSPVYSIILTLRNDVTMALPLAKWGGYIRSCLQKLRRRGCDAIFVIDPPKINQATGSILDTDSDWGPYYRLALEIAADEGASVVDVWGYWNQLSARGFDLRPLISDGIHPSDLGNALMTAQIFQCMRMAPQPSGAIWDRGTDTSDGFDLIAIYNDYNGAALTNISTYGTLIGPTSRQVQNGESPAKVWKVTSGNSLFFRPIAGIEAVIVSGLTAPDATGKPVVTTLGGASFTAVGELPNWTGPYIREYSIRYEPNSAATRDTAQPIRIQASGGDIYVLGIGFVTDYFTEAHDRWAAAAETGSWSNSSGTYYSQSMNTRKSNTVGDLLTITWFGSAMTFKCLVGPTSGRFSVQHDGGAVTNYDCYAASNQNLQMQLISNPAGVGWHTTVVTILTKNASATDNIIDIGGFVVTAAVHPPSFIDVYLSAGEAFILNDFWTKAEILEVLSGSPTRQVNWTSGAASYTLSGTGAAVVRFSK